MKPAHVIAAGVNRGASTACEIADGALQQIERDNPSVNAFTRVLGQRAREDATRVDLAIRSGRRALPLAGVPFAVKDLFDVAGLITTAGSRVLEDNPPATRDAALVRRLTDAGALLLGTLNMDEFAYGFTTENAHHGPTHNPHDLTRSAGGSSGGSGAAVAAGMVPVALASDTNGSIRVPASFCGVYGLKPTYGRLSRSGSYPFVFSLDHLGPLAADLRERGAQLQDAGRAGGVPLGRCRGVHGVVWRRQGRARPPRARAQGV